MKNKTTEQLNSEELLKKYDLESNTRIWVGIPSKIVSILFALFALFSIYSTLFLTVLPEVKLSLFMGMIVIFGYLTYPISKKNVRENYLPIYDILLMVIGSASFFYYTIKAEEIIAKASITSIQAVIGLVGLLCLFELCRRCVGLPILCIVLALIVYAFAYKMSYGAPFDSALVSIMRELFFSTNGVLGTPLKVCNKYICLFIIFGAFLEKTGISEYFISLANRVAGSASGGPAKVAVISSALCGMVSGSSVGNTVTTGSVTIPMMKKTGYSPEFAGAVEAASSTGGQIMPPIMGAAAFLMAEYMDIPYGQVALKAILPAFFYFFGIYVAVHLEAKKLGLKGISKDELPKWNYLLKNAYLLLPLILLVYLVAGGLRTMQFSAAVSIVAAFIIGFVYKMINIENKKKAIIDSFDAGFNGLSNGTKGTLTVAVACGMAGIISGCITLTGLASSLINGIVALSGNAHIIGLVLTMLCCIVLGMGVPTTANYCIMASTCAPILIQLGFSKIAAHFFVFYFGIVADITPPVALAAYAGSAIAKSNPMKTGLNATKIAIAAFIVPYIFAYNPVMLLVDIGSWYEIILVIITATIGLFAVAVALNGYLYRKVSSVIRVVLLASGLAMMIPGYLTDLVGFVILVGVILYQKNGKVKHITN